MSLLRGLRKRIKELIKKKPKGLNETKARGILLHLEGKKPTKIAKLLQVHTATVYKWIKDFQEGGEKALYYKKREGRKKKVDEKKIDQQGLLGKTIKEAKAHIEEKLNVKISYSTAWRITRERLKIPYVKPYNKKRPINAEGILRERLKGVVKKGVKVLFVDEAGIRHDPSRVRRLGDKNV